MWERVTEDHLEFCLWTHRMNTSPNFAIRMEVNRAGESFSKEVAFKQRTKEFIEISQVKKDGVKMGREDF